MEVDTEIQLLQMRVDILEKETKGIKTDVHKIVNQLSAMKYTLIGVILAESPQAINAVKSLLGVG